MLLKTSSTFSSIFANNDYMKNMPNVKGTIEMCICREYALSPMICVSTEEYIRVLTNGLDDLGNVLLNRCRPGNELCKNAEKGM